MNKWLKSLLPASAPAITGISAAASACAGGVCTVAATTAAPLVSAASSTGIAGALALSQQGSLLDLTHTVTRHVMVFPVWNILAFILLSAAFMANIWQFSKQRAFIPAILLWLSFVGLSLTELWRLPIPAPQEWQWAGLALSVPWFIGLPWIGDNLKSGIRRLIPWLLGVYGLLGFAFVFYLQFVKGIEPCALCYMERGGLFLALFGLLLPRFWKFGSTTIFWFIAESLAVWQMLEWKHSVKPLAICSGNHLSCGAAGGHLIFGIPLIILAVIYFAVGTTLSIMLTPGKH